MITNLINLILLDIHRCLLMRMKRFMLSITKEMEKILEKERLKRMLPSIPETARVIIGEYFNSKELIQGNSSSK